MTTTYEAIKKKLEEFYKSDENIKSCMIIDEQLEGILIIPETFKDEILYAWSDIEHILKNQVKVMKKYGLADLVQMNFNILEFGVMMYLLESGVVLVIVTDKTDLGPELIKIDRKTRKELMPSINKEILG